jgi:hypothetical protein
VYSQEPTTGLNPEPDESIALPQTLFFYYYYYYLFTAIGFAPGGSGPYTTQLQDPFSVRITHLLKLEMNICVRCCMRG